MNYTAIIIDDEPWTREVVKKLGKWKKLGIEIIAEASDGEIGLELVHKLNPDIVITDVKMNHLGGLELAELLNQKPNAPLILVISGYDDYTYMRKALKCGVQDYLLKPLKEAELNKQLQECVKLLDKSIIDRSRQLNLAIPDYPWLPFFRKAKEKLSDALHGNGSPETEAILEELYNEIHQDTDISSEIFIYLTLTELLRAHIVALGYNEAEIFPDNSLNYVFISGNTLQNLFEFLKNSFQKAFIEIGRLKGASKLDMKEILAYLDENYLEDLSLEKVAEKYHVTKEHLSRTFKQYKKEGFVGYLTKKRMEKAKELICYYNIPLKDVGSMLGYIDTSHFYRVFKKFFGITPGEMKEEYINKWQ